MRNERTERAKTTTATTPTSSMAPSPLGGGLGGPSGQMTLQGLEDIGSMSMEEDSMGEMQLITPGAGPSAGKNKSKNKNKKKKKKRKNKK